MKHWVGLFAVMMVASVAFSADRQLAWPRFRGPNGSGIAESEKPPVELGPETNVRWKVPTPEGFSSPIVVGDMLVITALDEGKLYTIAYRRADGSEAWRALAPARELEGYHTIESSPAASTPATDGQRIISYFGSCGLICYDLSGNELWTFELPPAVTVGDLGSGVSPILAGRTVVLVRDELEDSRILALDAGTGRLLWEKKRQSPVSYSTPVVWHTLAGTQVVAAGHARMIGYDLQSGAERWYVTSVPSGCCASPLIADGILYFAGWSPGGAEDPEYQMPAFDDLLRDLDANGDDVLSRAEAEQALEGFFDVQDGNKDGTITRDEHDKLRELMLDGQNAVFALQAGGSGNVTDSHVLWKQTRGLPYIASAILCRGQLIMVKDGGIVTAYDAQSGKQVYLQRLVAPGRYCASPVAANGNVYFTSFDDGVVTVVRAGSDHPEVVAANPALGEQVAATPAVADDTLYVRTEKHLYAFGTAQ